MERAILRVQINTDETGAFITATRLREQGESQLHKQIPIQKLNASRTPHKMIGDTASDLLTTLLEQ